MQRVKTSTAVAVLPADPAGGTPGYFANPNPGGGVPATVPNYEWYNNVQEELMAVIEGQSIVPAGADRTQLRQAIAKMITSAQHAVVIDGVTFEASVVNAEVVRWDSGNTRFDEAVADGTANNLAVGIADVTNSKVYLYGECPLFSGLTPGARYYLDGTTAGAITATAPADAVMIGIAKSATVLWVDVDAVHRPTVQVLVCSDQKAQGTHGGASISGTQTRTLNTTEKNTISGASLSANQIVLPAGTYKVDAIVPAINVNFSRAYLYNVTDAAVAILGSTENSTATGTADAVVTLSHVFGDITIAAAKTFEIRHYTSEAQASYGLGVAANAATFVEQYTKIYIEKR